VIEEVKREEEIPNSKEHEPCMKNGIDEKEHLESAKYMIEVPSWLDQQLKNKALIILDPKASFEAILARV
jgi:hypothetical protein